MIYLDNAATSFPKPRAVIRDLNFCLKKYCGNPGRSSHKLSIKAIEEIYNTRELIAEMIDAEGAEHIIFTYNATYALNIAIKSYVSEKCHIITSDFEHNSVIRPLESLKQSLGVEYSLIDTAKDIRTELNKALRPDTKGIICSICSNVFGRSLPLSVLSEFAKTNSLFLIIDASQALGHMHIDLKKTPCDALCAPGHKSLFGIQGCGFAYFKDKYRRKCLIEGGSGANSIDKEMPMLLPEGYEAGTLSTPAIISLGAGIRFINKIGLDEISSKLNAMTQSLYDRLRYIKEIDAYPVGCGLLSFNIKDISSSVIAKELDNAGICVRGGLHCAPSVHKILGTLGQGAVRASLSYLNSQGDIEYLYKVTREIANKI